MADRIRGQRDSQGDNWNWGPPGGGDGQPTRLPWAQIALVAAAVASIGIGIGLLTLTDGDGGDASTNGSTVTPTGAQSASVNATAEKSAGPTITATPSPTPLSAGIRLFAWARQTNKWAEGALPAGAGYREGERIPVLMSIDRATPGRSYEIAIRYQCGTDRGAGLDFLSSPGEADSAALSAEPAPGRERPDSTVPIPNDPQIGFDESTERLYLWGGAFHQSPQGPLPPQCEREKEIRVVVVALKETVSLIFACHLASAQDWGEGKGSASGGPLTVEVGVVGSVKARLIVEEGAVQP